MPVPLVVILTLNWNHPADTIDCLASAAAQSHPRTALMVVDNGSTDDSVERITQAHPAAEMIRSRRNLGFAAGFNLGLRRALAQGADFVFLVNNDTTFAADCVARLLEQASAQVGLLAPAIYYAEKPELPWSLGGRLNRLTLEMDGDRPAERPQALAIAERQGALDRDLMPLCGALISRAALERVGLLDERFFLYYEDMDFSLRLRRAGYRILLVPAAKMWHRVSLSSGGRDSPAERYWMARSSVLYFRKYVAGLRWLIVGPYRTGSAIKTSLRLAMGGQGAAARAYLRGLRDGLREPVCAW